MRRALTVTAAVFVQATAAQGQQPCLDAAAPLHVLARSVEWQPSERAERRAYPLLRRYLQSGSPSENRDAALAYRAVLTQDPHDVHSTETLALLVAMGPDLNYPDAENYRFTRVSGYSNAARAGARELLRLVREDSTRWLHAVALARQALASPGTSRVAQAEEAIERALRHAPAHTALQLAKYDLLVLRRRHADAKRVAAAIGSECSAVRHARAESMILTGDSAAGARLYLDALAAAPDAELSRFMEDARTAMTRAQRDEFRGLGADQRATWLRLFWEHNAATSGRTIETRITDHLQRAAWANAHDRTPAIPPSSTRPISWATDTVHHEPWGPRGILYVRHGPPHRRYAASYPPAEFEGWVYIVDEQPWTFLFVRGRASEHQEAPEPPPATQADMHEDPVEAATDDPFAEVERRGWQLITRPGCLNTTSFTGRFDAERMMRRLETGEPLDIRELYVALSSFDDRYAELAKGCTYAATMRPYPPLAKLTREWRLDLERKHPDLNWRSSAVAPFEHQIRVAITTYQFESGAGEPELVTVYWIPSEDVFRREAPVGTLRVTASLADSMTTSYRRDAMLSVPAGGTNASALTGAFRWSAPGLSRGTVRISAVSATDSLIGGSGLAHVSVRPAERGASMSDVVIAAERASGALSRGVHSISPLPGHSVANGSRFRLFFELYRLSENAPIETTVKISSAEIRSIRQQLGIGRVPDRTFSFTTAAELDSRRISVQDFELAGELPPGRYRLTVSVRVDGRVLTRTAELTIAPVERDR